MDAATDTNAKRTCFDAATSTETKSEQKTPAAVAVKHVRGHIASLQPEIATILEKLALGCICQQSKSLTKASKLKG